jgi:hypothetical protein
MERNDRELILRVLKTNVELKRLYSEHIEIEKKLAPFEHRSFLTPAETVLVKALKKKKLFGVDRMLQIVNSHDGAPLGPVKIESTFPSEVVEAA